MGVLSCRQTVEQVRHRWPVRADRLGWMRMDGCWPERTDRAGVWACCHADKPSKKFATVGRNGWIEHGDGYGRAFMQTNRRTIRHRWPERADRARGWVWTCFHADKLSNKFATAGRKGQIGSGGCEWMGAGRNGRIVQLGRAGGSGGLNRSFRAARSGVRGRCRASL